MKAPKRVNKCLATLDSLENQFMYFSNGRPEGKHFKKELQEVRDNILYLSVEKKKDRIASAKKVINQGVNKVEFTFVQRIKAAIKFVFTGRM